MSIRYVAKKDCTVGDQEYKRGELVAEVTCARGTAAHFVEMLRGGLLRVERDMEPIEPPKAPAKKKPKEKTDE
jgi:hypothetical protein